MKYRILSVGVMIGATAIVTALKKKEDSEKKETKKLGNKIQDLKSYQVKVAAPDGGTFNMTVGAVDREQARRKVSGYYKEYGHSIIDVKEHL